jgi:hypothetical protein
MISRQNIILCSKTESAIGWGLTQYIILVFSEQLTNTERLTKGSKFHEKRT